MARADQILKAERLALAWKLLRHADASVAAEELVRVCSISKRQAYRYLQLAHELEEPPPLLDAKMAFTVRLSQSLVNRLHQYATATGLTLSEIVSRALLSILPRGRGRG